MSCDTPDNTGKIPDQKPQRLNGKLRACPETSPVAGDRIWFRASEV
jgi:hypothetical protein